ncbi:MAG: peptide deformylase [Tissierellia bacterium]|jgi:peptide deformylase|nr:peptide deformylase [Bacillota bacterium]NLK57843.1 peptide deformylase [Tissierellia bacterium]
MALRNIRKEGDPILRKISKPVGKITPRMKELAEDLLETMDAAEGAGLAAPQVGVLRRMVAVHLEDGPQILINPEIINEEGECTEIEGCLSIPGFAGTVKRPQKITVRYQTLEEETVETDAEDFFAKTVCHEVDHLNGILFRDLVVEEVDIEDIQETEDKEENEEA